MISVPRNTILVGDVRHRLAELPDASVDCVITSPPYFQLRDYGIDGQMGLEPTIDGWVSELRVVIRGVARVLRPTGSLWLNLGDSYSRHARFGAPPKSLLLAPNAWQRPSSRTAGRSATRSSGRKPTPCPTASAIGWPVDGRSSTS